MALSHEIKWKGGCEMQAYIQLNNRSTSDFNLRMIERMTNTPTPKRATTDLPQIQGVHDYSRGNQGETFFNERPLMWKFGKLEPLQHKREQLRYEIDQWIYTYTDGRIYDSLTPGLFYSQCTCLNIYYSPIKDNFFTVQFEFIGYPLRRSDRKEGAQTWDDFNFNTDVWQDVSFRTPPILDQLPFKTLAIGDQVHLGGWSQFRPGGKGRLANYETERSYEIIDMRDQEDTDYSKLIYSGIQYQLEDNSWVRAQDIVEARNDYVTAKLWNMGIVPIIPNIIQRAYTSTVAGLTVEIDGRFYNFHWLGPGEYAFNDKMALPKGQTELRLYGQGMQIDFDFRKEVL